MDNRLRPTLIRKPCLVYRFTSSSAAPQGNHSLRKRSHWAPHSMGTTTSPRPSSPPPPSSRFSLALFSLLRFPQPSSSLPPSAQLVRTRGGVCPGSPGALSRRPPVNDLRDESIVMD